MNAERIAAHLAQAIDDLDRITDWLTVGEHEAAGCLSATARDLNDLKLALERETLVRVLA